MCGIVGSWGRENNYDFVKTSLIELNSRGKDGCGIFYNNKIIYEKSPQSLPTQTSTSQFFALGHVLHAMVNNVPQPLQGKGIFAFNGEIYNWEELAVKYNINAKNDTHLLFQLLESFNTTTPDLLKSILYELDGVYAFVYQRDKHILISRDMLGVKPIFYETNNKELTVSSESKILSDSIEVSPGEIIQFNMNDFSKQKAKIELAFPQQNNDSYEQAQKKTWKLLKDAVKKRIPKNKKIGVLFSGGIDSTVIALLLKELGVDFTCYTAKVEGGNIQEAEDLIFAKEIALKYNLKLKIASVNLEELEEAVITSMKLIEDCDYIKTSVALPFFLSCQKAQEDSITVMFSGLGSEEIFAGYRRHKQCLDPNKECYEGLKIIHKRDLYRDDVITMANAQELRVPFLDKDLINYALQLPARYKIDMNKVEEIKDKVQGDPSLNSLVRSKIILRDCAKKYLGLEERYSERQKKAAQYGSKLDKGLLRLAKNKNCKKQYYLNQLWDNNIDKPRPKKIWY